jgi:hypothetical protein
MPTMLKSVLTELGATGSVNYQVIIGSPLKYGWNNSSDSQGSDSRVVVPQGNQQALVITEAIPLLNHTTYSDSNLYALEFYNLARSANANTRIYLYETWHCINSGTPVGCPFDSLGNIPWRQRLDDELPRWEGIVDYVNANKNPSDADMMLIPVGQAMAKLYDEIQASRVPGITNINQLFTDDIHPNDTGFYFVTMVQYATICARSPVGLPLQLHGLYTPYAAIPADLALALQQIAWDTVCGYAGSGVGC